MLRRPGGPPARTRALAASSLGEWWKMAAAQAVEEMRTRVVLGEFGVRNVRDRGAKEDGGGTGKRRPGVELGLTALSVGSRSTPLTFPVTTPVMMMPGTRAASRRWVGQEVSGRSEGPDLAGWVAGVVVFIQHACAPWTGHQTRWDNGPHKQVIPV